MLIAVFERFAGLRKCKKPCREFSQTCESSKNAAERFRRSAKA